MKKMVNWFLGLFGMVVIVEHELPSGNVVYSPIVIKGFHNPVIGCNHKRWKVKVKGEVYQCRNCGIERNIYHGTTIL